MIENVEQAGRLSGIEFQLDKISIRPNTTNSHRLIYWAKKANLQSSVVEALYEAFFCKGLDIGNRNTLATIANECGMDGPAVLLRLESDEDRELIINESLENGKSGIGGVPFFIFNEKYTLSGAQAVEVFREVLTKLNEENQNI